MKGNNTWRPYGNQYRGLRRHTEHQKGNPRVKIKKESIPNNKTHRYSTPASNDKTPEDEFIDINRAKQLLADGRPADALLVYLSLLAAGSRSGFMSRWSAITVHINCGCLLVRDSQYTRAVKVFHAGFQFIHFPNTKSQIQNLCIEHEKQLRTCTIHNMVIALIMNGSLSHAKKWLLQPEVTDHHLSATLLRKIETRTLSPNTILPETLLSSLHVMNGQRSIDVYLMSECQQLRRSSIRPQAASNQPVMSTLTSNGQRTAGFPQQSTLSQQSCATTEVLESLKSWFVQQPAPPIGSRPQTARNTIKLKPSIKRAHSVNADNHLKEVLRRTGGCLPTDTSERSQASDDLLTMKPPADGILPTRPQTAKIALQQQQSSQISSSGGFGRPHTAGTKRLSSTEVNCTPELELQQQLEESNNQSSGVVVKQQYSQPPLIPSNDKIRKSSTSGDNQGKSYPFSGRPHTAGNASRVTIHSNGVREDPFSTTETEGKYPEQQVVVPKTASHKQEHQQLPQGSQQLSVGRPRTAGSQFRSAKPPADSNSGSSQPPISNLKRPLTAVFENSGNHNNNESYFSKVADWTSGDVPTSPTSPVPSTQKVCKQPSSELRSNSKVIDNDWNGRAILRNSAPNAVVPFYGGASPPRARSQGSVQYSYSYSWVANVASTAGSLQTYSCVAVDITTTQIGVGKYHIISYKNKRFLAQGFAVPTDQYHQNDAQALRSGLNNASKMKGPHIAKLSCVLYVTDTTTAWLCYKGLENSRIPLSEIISKNVDIDPRDVVGFIREMLLAVASVSVSSPFGYFNNGIGLDNIFCEPSSTMLFKNPVICGCEMWSCSAVPPQPGPSRDTRAVGVLVSKFHPISKESSITVSTPSSVSAASWLLSPLYKSLSSGMSAQQLLGSNTKVWRDLSNWLRFHNMIIDGYQKIDLFRGYLSQLTRDRTDYHIIVRRTFVYEDVAEAFKAMESSDFVSVLNVSFVGESAVDFGGLANEMFVEFLQSVLLKYFEPISGPNDTTCYLPLPTASTTSMRTLGMVLLKCLIDKRCLYLPFPPILFKFLLDSNDDVNQKTSEFPVSADDWLSEMSHCDTKAYVSMTSALQQASSKASSDRTEYIKSLDLFENDGDQVTSLESLKLYIQNVCISRLVGCRRKQLAAIKEGFRYFDLSSGTIYPLLMYRDLVLLLCGEDTLDGDCVINNIDFRNWSKSESTPYFLCSLLRQLSVTDLRSFLRLCMGSSSLPHGGLAKKIGIFKSDRLYAHTCFHQLSLPEFPSVEELHSALKIAFQTLRDAPALEDDDIGE